MVIARPMVAVLDVAGRPHPRIVSLSALIQDRRAKRPVALPEAGFVAGRREGPWGYPSLWLRSLPGPDADRWEPWRDARAWTGPDEPPGLLSLARAIGPDHMAREAAAEVRRELARAITDAWREDRQLRLRVYRMLRRD